MSSILKVDTLQDTGANTILASDGSGNVTTNKILRPAFSAKQNADQSIPNTTSTKLNFQTEEWDTDSAFDNSTNYRFTVPSGKAGKYFFSARYLIRSGDDKKYIIKFHLNGTAVLTTESQEVTGAGSGTAGIQTQSILDLSVGDYVEVFAYHSTGSSKDTYKDYTIFQGYRIGD